MIEFMSQNKVSSFFDRTIQSDDESCWLWIGHTGPDGYGRFMVKSRRNDPKPPHYVMAHRWSWSYHNDAEIPDGMHVCHRCDNPSCVNPYHLFIGTNQDNVRDRDEKGRMRESAGEKNPASDSDQKFHLAITRRSDA